MAGHLLRSRRSIARRSSYRPFLEMLESRAVPTVLPAGFTETTVVSGFSGPTNMELSPDGRLFVLTQGGNVKLVHSDGTTFTALHLTVDSTGERGLLGIAFDPHYASNHFVYLYFTNPNAGGTATGVHNQISRFTVDDTNPQQPIFGNEAPILDLNDLSSATNHNGGGLHFGASGMLFLGVGENANPSNSQTLGNLLGKLLRINVHGFVGVRDDTTVGHIIPMDNPFVGTASGINQLIYALGLRNPFTFAVQPGTGKIFINDVGQSTWEEINQAFAGANYGWSDSEGFKKSGDQNTTIGTYHDPLLAYNHSGGPVGGGSAIVGGAFYNPITAQFPSNYFGKYFYEDLSAQWIRVFAAGHPGSLSNPDTSSGFATGDPGATVAMKVDAAGNLYFLSQNAGGVERISYQPVAVALNAGGAAAGSFAADADFQGGTANQVSNTIDTSQVNSPAPQAVYQSWRDGTFTYTLPNLTAGASYNVRLDFSENAATGPGQDVFNVVINGKTVLKNFDVFAAAGGAFQAIERDFATSASAGGTITVAFNSVTGNARVGGISATPILVAAPVLSSATPGNGQVTLTWAAAPGAAGYRVHFGTLSYVDASGSPLAVGKVTTATITGLVNGQTYNFWVEAVSGSAVSPNSNELTATPSGTAPLSAVPASLLARRATPEPMDAYFLGPLAPERVPLSPALIAFAVQSNLAGTTENPTHYVPRTESASKPMTVGVSDNAGWEALFPLAEESFARR